MYNNGGQLEHFQKGELIDPYDQEVFFERKPTFFSKFIFLYLCVRLTI
jgi:hypothetical protein